MEGCRVWVGVGASEQTHRKAEEQERAGYVPTSRSHSGGVAGDVEASDVWAYACDLTHIPRLGGGPQKHWTRGLLLYMLREQAGHKEVQHHSLIHSRKSKTQCRKNFPTPLLPDTSRVS